MDKLLLDVAEVAQTLGICRTKTYRLIRANRIPAFKIDGAIKVPIDKLKAWIDAQVAGQEVANQKP